MCMRCDVKCHLSRLSKPREKDANHSDTISEYASMYTYGFGHISFQVQSASIPFC